MSNELIFIIGTERSGSNLIRLILNCHPNIAIPHPPHIMKNFSHLEPLYGDLSNDVNFKLLIRDVVTMVKLHPYPWEIKLDENKIFAAVKERNLINVYFAIYDQYRENTHKVRWGCKSTFMVNHVAAVKKYYPKAKFIYVVRDGRDVAASAKKSIFNHYSVYYIARLWKEEQDTGISWLKKLPPDEIFLIRYEDLISDPERWVKALSAFLGEQYREEMLNFFQTDEARKCSALSAAWKNTARPIMKDNFGKFKLELREKEISLFEAIAGEELKYFSYELTKPLPESEEIRVDMARFRFRYLCEETVLMIKVQFQHLFTDKNILLRFKKFCFMKWVRVARSLRWN